MGFKLSEICCFFVVGCGGWGGRGGSGVRWGLMFSIGAVIGSAGPEIML